MNVMIDWPGGAADSISKRLRDGLQKTAQFWEWMGILAEIWGLEISRMCGQLHVDLDLIATRS